MEKSELRIKIEEEIDKLIELSEGYVNEDIGIHKMEKGIMSQLLSFGLLVLKYIIKGKLSKLGDYELSIESYKSIGTKPRKYVSLFGMLEFERPGYWSKEIGQCFKLDEVLELPSGIYWSYNLQKLVGKSSTELDFRESVNLINELLGLGLSGKFSERNTGRLGAMVEDFYDTFNKELEEEGLHFMCGFDGKGVPKIKRALSIRDNPKKRLSRGEKKGVKQMATVSVTASFTSQQRTADSIIKGLMGESSTENEKGSDEVSKKEETDNKFYKNIHRRGFLADQEKAIEYGIQELKLRMKNPKSKFVVPIDAGIGLEDKILECVKKYKLKGKFDGIVIDIVHVSEYVWESATAIFGEQSKFRRPWVKRILEKILKSEMEEVIEELIEHRDKTSLTENKKKQLNKAITYFTNHKHKMNYQWFLKKGYPISSSIIESTCKHLIKDRMEQSGMRWSSKGAQNMMDLRAVKINNDMTGFINYVIKKERKVNVIKIAA